jgi:hypothetical protein
VNQYSIPQGQRYSPIAVPSFAIDSIDLNRSCFPSSNVQSIRRRNPVYATIRRVPNGKLMVLPLCVIGALALPLWTERDTAQPAFRELSDSQLARYCGLQSNCIDQPANNLCYANAGALCQGTPQAGTNSCDAVGYPPGSAFDCWGGGEACVGDSQICWQETESPKNHAACVYTGVSGQACLFDETHCRKVMINGCCQTVYYPDETCACKCLEMTEVNDGYRCVCHNPT